MFKKDINLLALHKNLKDPFIQKIQDKFLLHLNFQIVLLEFY